MDGASPYALVLAAPVVLTEFASSYTAPFFTVSLSEPMEGLVSMPWRILPGTATADYEGYSSLTGTEVFERGETLQTIPLHVCGDELPEADESLVLKADAPTGTATLPAAALQIQTMGWLRDDDGAAESLALFVGSPEVVEGDEGRPVARFAFDLSRPAPSDLAIGYTTLDGTAEAGEDCVARSGTLRLAEGRSAGTVDMAIRGDTKIEDAEAFSLRLSLPDAVAQTFGTATIRDDASTGIWVQNGTGGADRLRGYALRDTIRGRDGDVRLWVSDGNDRLYGAAATTG